MSFDSEDETPESLAYFKAQASERAVESWNRLSPKEQQEMQGLLDELLSESPRKAGLQRLTELTEEMGGYDAEDAPSVNDQYTDEALAQER